MTTHEWETLLDGTEGVSLTAGHETFPAFVDDPDQSDVQLPCVWIRGVDGWPNIDAPENLTPVLAASIDAVTEVARLRRAIETMLSDWEHKAACTTERRDLSEPGTTEHSTAARFLKAHQHVTRTLTRILEGEAHD